MGLVDQGERRNIMVSSNATSPEEMIAALPPDRRDAIAKVREVVRANLPAGYEEGMLFGMIGWYVPLERFPDTYNKQPLGLAGLANQKNYMALYLNNVYGDPETDPGFASGLQRRARSSTWASPAFASGRWMTCRSMSSPRRSPGRRSTNTSRVTSRFAVPRARGR